MQYALIENGQVTKVGLPSTGTLKDGCTVSGYDKLAHEKLLIEGWLPLVEGTIPEYNIETQYIQQNGYNISANDVKSVYVVLDRVLPSLDEIKQNQMKKVSQDCNTFILSGFNSTAKNNIEKHYDFQYEDQINMEALKNNIKDGMFPNGVTWKNSEQLACELWTNEEFLQLYVEAMTFKLTNVQRCEQLKIAIFNANDVTIVNAIVW
jgi:cellulose synthase/poly-beta-1,6-N-acetylglucosamine synthase-like glycosyltransferase